MKDRWAVVEHELSSHGHYEMTFEELEHAARMAWRNSPRCPGRIQWKNLTLADCRKITTLEQMYEALCRQIVDSTNGGNIRPVISVFPQRLPAARDRFRVWNRQLIAYAGFEQEDGSVVGDPMYVAFTKVCTHCMCPVGMYFHIVLCP